MVKNKGHDLLVARPFKKPKTASRFVTKIKENGKNAAHRRFIFPGRPPALEVSERTRSNLHPLRPAGGRLVCQPVRPGVQTIRRPGLLSRQKTGRPVDTGRRRCLPMNTPLEGQIVRVVRRRGNYFRYRSGRRIPPTLGEIGT